MILSSPQAWLLSVSSAGRAICGQASQCHSCDAQGAGISFPEPSSLRSIFRLPSFYYSHEIAFMRIAYSTLRSRCGRVDRRRAQWAGAAATGGEWIRGLANAWRTPWRKKLCRSWGITLKSPCHLKQGRRTLIRLTLAFSSQSYLAFSLFWDCYCNGTE